MARPKRFSVLRDPVHGDVYLTHEELRVLDTPEVQRLRGIKQLGTAYLVYPGAVHTRFDHSIGTVHVAQKMIEAIRLSFDLDPAGSSTPSCAASIMAFHHLPPRARQRVTGCKRHRPRGFDDSPLVILTIFIDR